MRFCLECHLWYIKLIYNFSAYCALMLFHFSSGHHHYTFIFSIASFLVSYVVLHIFLSTDLILFSLYILSLLEQQIIHRKSLGQSDFYFERNVYFSNDALNDQKWKHRRLKCYKRFLFQINAVLLNFIFIKETWKTVVYSANVFNIDIVKKCFLSPNHIRMNSEDHVTPKTGVMAAENSAFHHRNKLHFKMY